MVIHATAVSFRGRGVLITGEAGSGKSTLGLQLLQLGCDLVADDRVNLTQFGDQIIASSPEPMAGLLEARGVGIQKASSTPGASIVLAIDLDRTEADRLPPDRALRLFDVNIPLLRKVEGVHFPYAVMQYLREGKAEV
jgi:HPr kinase/phosphorylase